MKRIFIVSLLIALFAISCTNADRSKMNGNLHDSRKWGKVIRQELVISDFTSIELSEDFDVVYCQDSVPSVIIEGNENVVAYHHVEVVNGVLVDHKTDDAPNNMPTVRLVVASPMLKSISVTGAGDIDIKDYVAVDDLNLELSGSGDIDIEHVECTSLKAVVSGSGDIKIDNAVCSGNADFGLTGSGDLNVEVSCNNVDIEVTGSGDADLNVKCNVVNASATGTGNLKLEGVVDVLNRRTSGLASIDTKKLDVNHINLK